ncbi:MAG TPA: hypothetical protein VJQ56_05195, partial [Blastocatellia bacterium]|nr:hypothetical protein [Blastocatellia bacterium]
ANIQSQFDTLAEDVKNAERGLVDSLAQKYVDNLKGIDDLIEKYKQDDKGLVDKAMEAVQGVIDTILQLKEMLMGILAKAGDVIDAIVADPIGFLGNLVTGIKMGLSAFLGNIGEHLKSGLMGWLFGAVAAAGIQMPETFDLKGLLSLGAQILGLTYQNFRARAVKIVGEPVVQAMETAVEIFQILMTQGLGGVWSYIKDMLGNLTEMVMSGIRDWVATKVITAGITWLLSMLNPASAFVRACKMIVDVVMFFIERGSQIVSLVNAVLDSIAAIASGSLGAMASAVEGALAKAVPVAISFLASLLGLGGISDVIRTNIEKIQAPVNKAIDWLIGKAVKLAKGIAGLFGGKKKKDKDPPAKPEEDLEGAQAAAGEAVASRLGPDATLDEARGVLPGVLNDLRPMGLKGLSLGPEQEDGSVPIMAEASPKKRVKELVAKNVSVAVSATITVQGAPVMDDVFRKPRKYYDPVKGPVNEPGENPLFSSAFNPAQQAELIGTGTGPGTGTGAGTGRAATLPIVAQPMGTPAKKGSQPSAGYIVEPAVGSQSLEVLSWNTSAPEKGNNTSHAEHQFTEWIESRPSSWRARIIEVRIVVEGRPVCDRCLADMGLMRGLIEGDRLRASQSSPVFNVTDKTGVVNVPFEIR